MTRWPWVVWTDRELEAPRRGFSRAELEATLRHLADRGDLRCRMQEEHVDGDVVPPIVPVNLRTWRSSARSG